jgi:CBS domain-containing protein
MKESYVFEIMTENVTTCSPDTALKEVVKILSSKSLSSLVIIKDGEPIGIITERDMVSILADMLNDVIWDNLSIDHFMTSPTYTIRSDVALTEAVIFATSKNIRNLPVVDNNNKLIGLLTQTEMVHGLSKDLSMYNQFYNG